MQSYNGKITVVIFVAAAIIFTAIGLAIFKDVDPSLMDISVIK